MIEREIVYWAVGEVETLSATTPEQALWDWVEERRGWADIPETIEVDGYA